MPRIVFVFVFLTILPGCSYLTVESSEEVVPASRSPVSTPASTATTAQVTGAVNFQPQAEPVGASTPDTAALDTVVVAAAGNISSCNSPGDEITAALLDGIGGLVIVVGDSAHAGGSLDEFTDCYNPTWGRHLHRTWTIPGNREYYQPGANSFFAFAGTAAGDAQRGYYSVDLSLHWHAVMLNSNCRQVGGCGPGSEQYEWLRADLKAHADMHVIAVIHDARYSSGRHGNSPWIDPLWDLLYANGADLLLGAHDHHYERFAPLDNEGSVDDAHGIREFIVGTGGKGLRGISEIQPHSEVREHHTYGVLKLTLRPDGYDWLFVSAPGSSFTDAGSANLD